MKRNEIVALADQSIRGVATLYSTILLQDVRACRETSFDSDDGLLGAGATKTHAGLSSTFASLVTGSFQGFMLRIHLAAVGGKMDGAYHLADPASDA